MKFAFIAAAAALAFGSVSLPSAPAEAHASNCSYFNGPYCELAHNARHHNWRPPVVWQPGSYYGGGCQGGNWSYPYGQTQSYGCQPYGYPAATPDWQTPGTCQIESAFGCRFRTPTTYDGGLYGGYGTGGYGTGGYGGYYGGY